MRIQDIRIEDVSNAEKLIIRVLRGDNVSFSERIEAGCLALTLPTERIEKLLRELRAHKAGISSQNLGLVHPEQIRKQRTNCAPDKPTSVHRRNIRKLFVPKGYLKPKIILY